MKEAAMNGEFSEIHCWNLGRYLYHEQRKKGTSNKLQQKKKRKKK